MSREGRLGLCLVILAAGTGGRAGDGTPGTVEVALSIDTEFVTTGDLSGDLREDLLTVNRGWVSVWFNRGGGRFAPSSYGKFRACRDTVEILSRDLDLDGDADLVLGPAREATVILLENLADGYFRRTLHAIEGRATALAAADFTGDGRTDLVIGEDGTRLVVLVQANDGSWSRRGEIEASPQGFGVGDLDADGREDLLVKTLDGTSLKAFWNERDGMFSSGSLPVDRVLGFLIADFDRDGLDDVIVLEGDQSVVLLPNDGTRRPRPTHHLRFPAAVRAIELADVDGDGSDDLLGLSSEKLFYRDLQDEGAAWSELSLPFQPTRVLPTDADGDGDDDLIVHSKPEAKAALLLLDLHRGPRWRRTIEKADEFASVSKRSDDGSLATKFALAVSSGALPRGAVFFQDVKHYPLHQEFLEEIMGVRFASTGAESYDASVNRRGTRRWYVGMIEEAPSPEGLRYGFTIAGAFEDDPGELPTEEEVAFVHRALKGAFRLTPLGYRPRNPLARDSASTWREADFPLFPEEARESRDFRAYSLGRVAGRVRILGEPGGLEAGSFGPHDVVVLERVPRDLPGPFAALITSEPQSEFSHLAVRALRRGSPNAYVRGATRAFRRWEGDLVEIEVREDGYRVREGVPQALPARERREPRVFPPLDEECSDLPDLLELALSSEMRSPESRFGGKAANLARLQQEVLTGSLSRYRERGFAIPLRYYLEFVRANSLPSAIDGRRRVTYEGYVRELLAEPRFLADSGFRARSLSELRTHMREHGKVPESLLEPVSQRIVDTFGPGALRGMRVRFRSSSNVEDIEGFAGAGLHDSTSVCLADDLDGDVAGPSLCKTSWEDERGVARGLKKVWASLWSFRAFEERTVHGVAHESCAMAVLVTRTFSNERAGGIALTGNPTNPRDPRYVVSAQTGETNVARPPPGVIAEKTFLDFSTGEVRIERAVGSSLIPEGERVLSDDQLRELGCLLRHIERRFSGNPPASGYRTLVEAEFKIDRDGKLAVKQVRRVPVRHPESPPIVLRVPEETALYGAFVPFRSAEKAYRLKSTLVFREGLVPLRPYQRAFRGDLVEELRLGKEVARPAREGLFTVSRYSRGASARFFFGFEQPFTFSDGREVVVRLRDLSIASEGRAAAGTIDLRDELRNGRAMVEARLDDREMIYYTPMPSYRASLINVTLADGSRLRLVEQMGKKPPSEYTPPTSLTRASLDLEGHRREVTGYWNLLFTAQRHHRDLRYRVRCDPPLELPSTREAIRVVEFHDPDPLKSVRKGSKRVNYLGEGFEVLRSREVTSIVREELAVQRDFQTRSGGEETRPRAED